MFVQQFFTKGLAHSSYLLGASNVCAIIDPQRDIEHYIEAAEEMGMSITHILETHLHADFVSGHMDLAKRTGARIYAPKAGQCHFPHEALAEGDSFDIGTINIRVLETPGHTPEHISYVVTDTTRGDEPVAVFCGDTLFVGDVGRPDLFPGMAHDLASQLYDNLHQKLMKLPDFCEVYPAHGAGSLCGRAMGAKRSSTIGYERHYNGALQTASKEEFISALTENMPPAPDHFSRCSAVNRDAPALTSSLPAAVPLEPADFYARLRAGNVLVLDVRSYDSYGGLHVPGSYHIDIGGNFATFAGWILPPDNDILLVTESLEQGYDATTWLRRVGLDRVIGQIDGGIFAYAKAGMPVRHTAQVPVHEISKHMGVGQGYQLLDVRSPTEFGSVHIEGAINIPVHELRTRHTELDASLPTMVMCASGHRSSLATSILEQRGFAQIMNVAGGMTGYSAAGFAPACPMCVAPHGPQTVQN